MGGPILSENLSPDRSMLTLYNISRHQATIHTYLVPYNTLNIKEERTNSASASAFWAHMGIKKFVFLRRFQKSKLTLVTKCT
jgi:hypothetical protein